MSRRIIILAGGASDTTAPAWPGGTTVTFGSVTSTSFTSAPSAAATDAVGVTGYRWSYDDATWNTVSDTSAVSHTGRSPGTSYTVYWQARDAAGNWSSSLSGSQTTNPKRNLLLRVG